MCWSPGFNEWIFTRWADCHSVLRDPRFSSNSAHSSQRLDGVWGLMRDTTSNLLLFVDPPDHTRLRGLVSQAFTPRRVESLRPRVQAIVDDLLDEASGHGNRTFDVMSDLAQPLPVIVICEMLGVPLQDRDKFGEWSSGASRLLDGELDQLTLSQSLGAAGELIQYFVGLLEERRTHPSDDLLSALVAARSEGDRLSDQELIATTILLFVAGHETTSNLIGNGTLALLRHPDQASWLRARADDAAAVRNAVEELLRYDPPVQITGRFATTDHEVAGVHVAKGEGVALMLAAANRDPDHYAEPDRLDLGRADPHHLAFSQGIHYCLGAALARLEGEVALPTLLQRFPDLELVTDDPPYREHRVLRGLSELAVRW